MDERVAAAVRRRARYACEYCLLPEKCHPGPFAIEHVISRQHGGTSTFGNLAYACLPGNRHKGPNSMGVDRTSSRTKLVPLFNPRRHKWSRHYRWDGPYLQARTAIGRVTIATLAMNDPVRVALRRELMEEAIFPPERV